MSQKFGWQKEYKDWGTCYLYDTDGNLVKQQTVALAWAQDVKSIPIMRVRAGGQLMEWDGKQQRIFHLVDCERNPDGQWDAIYAEQH